MTPPLTIQTPASHPLHTYLPTEPQSPLALTRTSRSGEISDLQRKLGAVMKRVVGEDAIPPASSSPPPPASPAWEITTPNRAPTADADGNMIEHHDGGSEYDAVDREGARRQSTPALPHPTRNAEARTPISSPGSYEALAALNPYLVDVDDLARRLSAVETPAPAPAGEDERGCRTARPQQLQQKEVEQDLESEFDSAYAAVVAGEKAALEALRHQIREESIEEEGASES
ncbi:hypothetical protein GGS24DRAFT_402182 [Hypoxylon argillaceum]|nr:hypothetical protein GGS24DRAFT_402182 [Hypoxylon argillaceum]KAI1148758.1 hypothetical protein F4825DRAFT_81386 [Nemania diffusa]